MKVFQTICFCFVLIHGIMAQFEGQVFWDQNQNQVLDSGEKGLPNVLVSDGLNVVKTAADGTYRLPGHPKNRFVVLTMPAGFQGKTFFQRIEAGQKRYDFALEKLAGKVDDGFSFIHITDTETDQNNSNWVEMLQAYIKHEKPAFLIHTGDICYRKGMHFHAEQVNTNTMGVPTYYCIGNHDLVDGPYGEALYETLFGPGWYSFEVGGTHFIVTPMLSGDYKPSYTKEDIYYWLKQLLAQLDPDQPKIIFNHDLLTGEEDFIYGISESASINLNEHNLKAWVYGHWHNGFYRYHGNSGVVSICTGVAQRGGIDHSLAQFRVFDVKPDGTFTTELIQSYVDHHLTIVAPTRRTYLQDGKLPILVNTYNSTAQTNQVEYQINQSAIRPLEQQTNWAWSAQHDFPETILPTDTLQISVSSHFNDGEKRSQTSMFQILPNSENRKLEQSWPNFLMNGQHHPVDFEGPTSPLQLQWVTNIGANTYMCSPIVADGKVFIASYDNGDARNCFLYAYDAVTGKGIWRYRLRNSIKGSIAYEDGKVFAADMQSNVYAVDAELGALVWQKHLEMRPLPGYISGVVAQDGVVYAGDGKSFTALEQSTGAIKWQNDQWNAGVGVPPSPTIGKKVIVASSNWNALYAHDLESGELLCRQKEFGTRFRDAAPVFYQDTLFVGTQNSLLALDPSSGKVLKQKEFEMKLNTNSTPLVTDKFIIVGTGSDGVVAFHREDFSMAWTLETGQSITTTTPYAEPPQRTVEASPVLVNDQEVCIGASDGVFYVIDAETGRLNWKMEVGVPILATVAVVDGYMYLVDIAGNLYCFTSSSGEKR